MRNEKSDKPEGTIWSEKSRKLLKTLSELNALLIHAYNDGDLEKAKNIKSKIESIDEEIARCLMELRYLEEIVEVIPE